MLSRQRNQPSKITVHHSSKPQTIQIRLNFPIQPPRLRRLLPPNRRQSSRLVLKWLPIILHRVLCTTLPLDAQGGIKGGLDLPFRLALRCPAPMDSGFRRNDGNCAKVPHRLNTDVPPLLDSRVWVLCATSRTTHSRSDHVRLPVARPLWIPAFAGMTGLCGVCRGARSFPPLAPSSRRGENGVLCFSLGSRVRGNDGYVGNDGCVRGRRGRYPPNPADTSTIASSTTSQRSSNSCAVIESGGETGRM